MDQWRTALDVALRDEPADLLLKNARIVNVFTCEIQTGNVAISGGRIVGIGDYTETASVIDLDGAYLAPSFIDGHIHTESSLLWLPEFAKAVVPHGTGAVVTDPHEIANVSGLAGLDAMIAAADGLPMGVHFTIPSCVPASPAETAGAEMTTDAIATALDYPQTVGLGEMMNFPGVLAGDSDIFDRLRLAESRRRDGHAPGLRGRRLDAYALSGMTSDHESTALDEGRQKLERGLMLMLREGSTEHNMLELLPLVTDATFSRCCFASDDRDCAMLLHQGHMDETLRRAVAAGLDPIRAIRMATFNTSDYWCLDGVGAIAPGYAANCVVLNDLDDFQASIVFWQGEIVAEDGRPSFETRFSIPEALSNTVHVGSLSVEDIKLPASDATRSVGAVDGQIVTRLLDVEPKLDDGYAVPDLDRDLLKLVCVERHNATGNVGVGYVQGFGLRRGALASSIAHDAHNIVAVGVTDADILRAVEAIVEMQGGLAIAVDGDIIGRLPLPVAGILSDQPLDATAQAYERIEQQAMDLGSQLASPFGLLAFMALSVIPEARVTDQGFLALA
ncbi:adenine deaminase [soil metagenome]